MRNDALTDTPYYPAHAFGFPTMADHHPVILHLLGARESNQQSAKAFRLDRMQPGEWPEINCNLEYDLNERAESMKRCVAQKNVTYFHNQLISGIRLSSGDQYRNRKVLPPTQDPFEQFRQRHINDPDYRVLIRANKEGNEKLKSETLDVMPRGFPPTLPDGREERKNRTIFHAQAP